MEIEGRTVMITGGGSGMGLAATRMLARCGAKVCLLGRRLEQIESQAKAVGGLSIQCDVSDEASLEQAFDELESRCGHASILIHAAASGRMLPLISADGRATDRALMRQVIETNVLGTLYSNQIFAERLSQHVNKSADVKGVIINVSSIGAIDGVVGASYVASKAAVNGLALTLAREFSDLGIRVMAIAPGGIDTPMFREGANEATHTLIAESVPALKRTGTPEEFASLVKHICENDYLNGSVVRLDGGMRIPFVNNVGKDSNSVN
ncbi:MAG: SDR family oxidoreductase [Pseudomonadota bacterium]